MDLKPFTNHILYKLALVITFFLFFFWFLLQKGSSCCKLAAGQCEEVRHEPTYLQQSVLERMKEEFV